MKKFYHSILPYLRKIHLYITLLLVFSFPFSIHFANIIIVIWLFSWLLQVNIKKIKDIPNKIFLILILSFFFLHIVGYFYSENQANALKIINRNLYILLFPLVIISARDLYKENFKNILSFFVVGNILAAIICLLNATISSFYIENGHLIFDAGVQKGLSFFESIGWEGNNFFYGQLSMFQHPSYFAMFIILALVFIIYLKNNYSKNSPNKNKIIKILTNDYIFIIILIFLSGIVFLLSSKINLLIIFLLLIFYIFSSKIKYKYFIFLFIIILSTLFIISNPRFTTFFTNISGKSGNKEIKIQSGVSRLFIWNSSVEVIKKNIIFGVGTGDVQDEISKKFEEKNYTKLLSNSYNLHNDFIETFVKFGIFGFLILISFFIFAFYNAIKQKKFLLLFFLIITILNFFVESMLNRIAGIYYFAFFGSFLIFVQYKTLKFNFVKIKTFTFKNFYKFILILIIISSIISIKIALNKKELVKQNRISLYKLTFFNNQFLNLYKILSPNNLWNQKMNWTTTKEDKNTTIPFKFETSESGTYKISALIKYYENDSTVYPRLTIKANYSDFTFTHKGYYSIKKDNNWHYYNIEIQTDTSKNLQSISGWVLDHTAINGKKHAEVKYIVLKKIEN